MRGVAAVTWGLAASVLLESTGAWTSFGSQSSIYTFQEFYSDAQYGPDFGYYSTGRILHADGPADNGAVEGGVDGGDQEWFNSYTTLPMSVSPDFAHMLCDRVVSMWQAMGRPARFFLVEFGGGTGMLARDVLRRSREAHPDFFGAVVRYIIAERSQAMRNAQRRTTAEFFTIGKLDILAVDAREAANVRPMLEAWADGQPIFGLVLSNELLDELDPVRLRLMWRVGRPPSPQRCADCNAYREAHVLHRVDVAALDALLSSPAAGAGGVPADVTVESLIWEGQVLPCGMLGTDALVRAMTAIAEDLRPAERGSCAPMLLCCLPFLLAVNQALQYNYDSLQPHRFLRREADGSRELLRLYRHHLLRTNSTVLLSKERYRMLRRLAVANGPEVERALLVGSAPSVLPGRVHSEEVFLALAPRRCKELHGWMQRQAERLAAAARLHNGVAWIFDGDAGASKTAMHLKMVVRPGEATFTEQASKLLDGGFLVTLDYGADADALAWQALIRPHYEGIHVMDARRENLEECTAVSYLECPGLQDLTTSVDFTEVSEAGRRLGGWKVLAYGPIFLLELGFDDAGTPDLAPPGDPYRLGHILERAGGLRTTGLQAWYRKPESDPWASFKVLVQHRGGYGASWTLGPAAAGEWTLPASPRLFGTPAPCWRRDITKPPLAALIASAAHRALTAKGRAARPAAEANVHKGSSPQLALPSAAHETDQAQQMVSLQEQFQVVLLQGTEPLATLVDAQHAAQQQAYADAHLALLLVDYHRLLLQPTGKECALPTPPSLLPEVREIAESRRLRELYGSDPFDRVFGDLTESIFGNATPPGPDSHPPYVCLASKALHGRCGAAVAAASPPASGSGQSLVS